MSETPWYRLCIFLTCVMKAAEIQAQCGKPNVGGNMFVVDESGLQIYPDGFNLTFQCSIGYKPEDALASKTIKCVGTEWTKLDLICTKRSCGALSDFPNGKYTYPSGNLFGATAIAVCNEGYSIVGANTRNCRENGWDGRAPVCEAVKCLPPQTIPNGNFHPEEEFYTYNAVVTYTCIDGNTLDGASEITCSSNGTFHPPPPRCIFVQCETPNVKNGVRIEGKSPPYGYKNFVKYKCNDGFTMDGSAFLTCEINGWDPPPPKCTRKEQCAKPNFGGNRETVDDSGQQMFPIDSTLTFKCSVGYQPVDASASKTVTCIGPEWTKLDLNCTKKSCQALPELANGKYTYPEGNMFGATVVAECNAGYTLVGDKNRICGENGWDGRAPVCQDKQIIKPPTTHPPSGGTGLKSSIIIIAVVSIVVVVG